MSSLHIRDIDEKTLISLKRLAKRHHRSLQGELHFILAKASELDCGNYAEDELDLVTVRCHNENRWRREDIYGPDGR